MALAAGWIAFPRALYVRRAEPLQFQHKVHAAKSGITQCSDCHALRPDGSFAGFPAVETCSTCHSDQVGTTAAEATLVNHYVKKGREVPWLEDDRQPSNVWFSHAVHLNRAGLKCAECHLNYGDSNIEPRLEIDRISGYSRRTMDMSACEDCHRKRHVEVSCLGCHQ
jgi:menaquinone reductase, multiheme cytochrome c subunit